MNAGAPRTVQGGSLDPAVPVRVAQVGFDGGHDNTSFDRQEIDADERDADIRIDHNPLVEHAIESVYETCRSSLTLKRHGTMIPAL